MTGSSRREKKSSRIFTLLDGGTTNWLDDFSIVLFDSMDLSSSIAKRKLWRRLQSPISISRWNDTFFFSLSMYDKRLINRIHDML